VTWNEAGPDTTRDRLQLAVADQRADIILRTPELGGDLADGEWGGPIHR
jgi:hypothetical protein